MEKIKEILKNKGLTQKDLAIKMGVKQETISRQINGNPTIETLLKIANVLDVDIKDLFYSTNKNNDVIHIIVNEEHKVFNNVEDLKKYVKEL